VAMYLALMARLSRGARVPELNRPPVRLMFTPLADIRPQYVRLDFVA
jgi:hypothetical protein